VTEATCRVTVVIPNRNGMAHLEECFATLSEQTFKDFRVVVVDNASSDESLEWIRQHQPQVTVVAREKDGGVSSSLNEGIRRADTEYVALLNNDVHVEPQWLETLVVELDARRDYDFAASLVIMYFERSKVNAAGDLYDVAYLRGYNRGFGERVEGFLKPCRVLGATGAAVLYRCGFFDDVGLYDEDFYMQHEDTDINLRALIAGKKCVFVPGSRVFHKIRATGSDYRPGVLLQLQYRNEGFVAGKDLPVSALLRGAAAGLWRDFRGTFPLRPWLWGKIPASFREASERNVARFTGFRMGLAKRREVWSTRKVSTAEIRWWLKHGTSEL
jgi:GT2 family glycosyltransferase